jgi:hypothetical protein
MTTGSLITKPATHPELIVLQYLIQISLPNKLLHFVFVHIHPVVKITTPEYIVVRVECTTLKLHHLKCHFCVSANPYKQRARTINFLATIRTFQLKNVYIKHINIYPSY